jgi:GNAT superfamily N-acetyltransferase
VNAVQIRQATPQDAQLVSDILTEAAQWLEKSGMPMWRADQLDPASIVADVAAGLYFLAQNGEDPAGTVRFQLEDVTFWPDALPQEAAYIHRFAIRRQYAGTGASTALLRWAVERTRQLGRRYLRLDCLESRPRLRAMYESFGFRHRDDRQVGADFVSRYEYEVTK